MPVGDPPFDPFDPYGAKMIFWGSPPWGRQHSVPIVERCPRCARSVRTWAEKYFDFPCLACRQRDCAGEHLDPKRIPRGRDDVPLAGEAVTWYCRLALVALAKANYATAIRLMRVAAEAMPPLPPGCPDEDSRCLALIHSLADSVLSWLRSRR